MPEKQNRKQPSTGRQLAAILFADIAGYTALMQKDEATARQMLDKFHFAINTKVESHQGKVVNNYGDGCLCTFDSAVSAMLCAKELQLDFQSLPKVPVRIGLHSGDVFFEKDNVYGDSVNLASRIESMGVPGAVLFSKKIRDEIKNQSDLKIKTLGKFAFKNVEEEMEVFALANEGFVIPKNKISEKAKPIKNNSGNSILILPLKDKSPEPDLEYFSDGLTEDIITDLSKVQALRVIARNSSMKLKASKKESTELAKELGVRYALNGSVRRAGRNLRINLQLVDSVDDSVVWAERYQGVLEQVFDFQEKVAQSVTKALDIKLNKKEERQISNHPIPDFVAYDYYLRARREIYKFEKEALEKAIGYLEKATEIVGENPLLLYGKGWVYFQLLNSGVSHDESLTERAESYAKRILELKHDDPKGLILWGMCGVRNDFRVGIRRWRKALNIEPNNPDILLWLGVHSLSTGQTRFSSRLLDRLISIEPLEPLNHALIGYTAFFDGRLNDIVQPTLRSLEIGPDVPIVQFCAVRILAAAGEYKKAIEVVEYIAQSGDDSTMAKSCLLFGSALRGQLDLAIVNDDPSFFDWAKGDAEWAQFFADAFALGNMEGLALEWLEIARQVGFINYPFLASYNPFLKNLRTQKRFQELLKKVKKEWQEFENEIADAEN